MSRHSSTETLIASQDTAKHQPITTEDAGYVDCLEIHEVRDFLKASRKYADSVHYHLNRVNRGVRESEDLSCMDIWDELMKGTQIRNNLINRCQKEISEEIAQGEANGANQDRLFFLRRHQKQMKSDLSTELITFESYKKDFRRSCRREWAEIQKDLN